MTDKFNTPEDAEIAFYEAIEHCDIATLSQVWSADENIVCIHPGANRIEGRAKVLESFSDMFAEPHSITFSISDALQTESDGLAIHLVREEIALDGQLVSVMVSTNIYHLEDGGWRMLLHHSSHEPESNIVDDFDDHDDYDDFDDFDDISETPPVLH